MCPVLPNTNNTHPDRVRHGAVFLS